MRPYTGEVLESVNWHPGCAELIFTGRQAFGREPALRDATASKPGGDGFVTGVYIDGVPIQMYTSHEDKQVVYTYRAEFVDLDGSVVVSQYGVRNQRDVHADRRGKRCDRQLQYRRALRREQ